MFPSLRKIQNAERLAFAVCTLFAIGHLHGYPSQVTGYDRTEQGAGVIVSGAKLVDFGVYEVKHSGKPGATVASSVRLLDKVDSIPARLKTEFGIRYILTGTPQNGRAVITIKVRHPKL